MERVGRYNLIKKLNSGGMGEVWLAHADGAENFRTRVVVKRLLPEAKQFSEHFITEAKLGALFQHNNLVTNLDFFEEKQNYYLVQQYVEGMDVDGLATKVGRLPIEWSVYIISEALRGLGFAHAAAIAGKPGGFVHRDMSPDNILVSCEAEVKVADFGIAKANVPGRSRTAINARTFKGKPSYASPEHLNGIEVDRRTDIYATGVILYELLTGARAFPFTMETFAFLHRVASGEVAPIRSLNPDVSDTLAAVVTRMMHPDREQRFQTADDARAELLRAVPGAMHIDRELAATVKRHTDSQRRLTSPHIRVGDKIAMPTPDYQGGVVVAAAPEDATTKHPSGPHAEGVVAAPIERETSAPEEVIDDKPVRTNGAKANGAVSDRATVPLSREVVSAIEHKDGYRIFYGLDGKPLRREEVVQLLFRLTWFASASDVNREVNNGRGPVDFKVSRGASDKSLVEFKLAKNTKLKANLQHQVGIYKKANSTLKALTVIVSFSTSEMKRAKSILRSINRENDPNVILIDADSRHRLSASKVG